MDRDPTPSATPAPPAPAPRKKRRWLRTVALALFGLLCLAVAAPHVLNLGFARRKVESSLSEQLHTKVELGDLGFTWFSGLSLGDLKIHNPAGFAQDHPFLSLKSLQGDLSMLQLLRGRLDLSGTVPGLVVHVDQDEQGRSNAEALGQTGKDRPKYSGVSVIDEPSDGMDLGRMRLDLKLVDAVVEIRRNGELIESLQKLECALSKEFGSQVFRMDLKADLHRPTTPGQPGNVALQASVDAQALTLDGQLAATGLDLSRYRPLVAAMLGDGSLTALEGIVNGNLQVRGKGREGEQELFLEGNLAVQAPHLAGSLLRGMDVKAQRWQLVPNLHVVPGKAGGQPTVDAARFSADLGFATMRGLPAAELQQLLGGTGLGFAFTLDLDALAAFGGPIADMQQNGGSVQGRLGLPIGSKLPELAQLPGLLRAEATLKAAHLQAFGFAFTNATAAMTVKDGAFTTRTGDGTLVNGGPASCTVDIDLKDGKRLPFQLAVTWKGGNAGDAAVWLLRYAAPVLAGLEARSDMTATADLDLKLQGPTLRTPGETWLQFFDVWSGSGNLTLRNTAFTPAPALRALADAIAGNQGRVTMEHFAGAFSMHHGTVQSQLMKLQSKGSEYGFQGQTRLDGSLEWTVDLTPILQQHRDGAKVAAAFGGKSIQAGIAGTLDAPQLRMPDLATLLQNAVQEALKDKAGDAVQKAIEDLFGKKKKQ